MKTSRKQILQSGVEKSMSSPEVFLPAFFLAPDSERERKMTATSGRKCYERYEIQPDWVVGENVAGILSMVQPGSETALGREESLFGEVDRKEYCIGRNTSSKQCVTTLNVKDISSNRLLFRLVPSERRTEETVSSLLPTVQTQGLRYATKMGRQHSIR